jgi:hypothetical protein
MCALRQPQQRTWTTCRLITGFIVFPLTLHINTEYFFLLATEQKHTNNRCTHNVISCLDLSRSYHHYLFISQPGSQSVKYRIPGVLSQADWRDTDLNISTNRFTNALYNNNVCPNKNDQWVRVWRVIIWCSEWFHLHYHSWVYWGYCGGVVSFYAVAWNQRPFFHIGVRLYKQKKDL